MRLINHIVGLLLLLQFGAAFVHIGVRQELDSPLPGCAAQCLTTLLPTSRCRADDTACLCTDQDFLAASILCVQSNCTVKDVLITTNIQTTQLCPQPVRDDSYETIVVTWSMHGVATLSFVARLISRLPVAGGSGYGWDDWTILLATVLLIPLNVLCSMMARIGLGQDIWMVQFEDITQILYYFWIDEYLYTFILDITKISILLLYLRMWPDDESRKFRNCCIFLMVVLAIHAVVMNIALAAGCEPVSYAWTQWDGEHEGRCISYLGQIYATAALNILFDLLVFLLPLPKLVKLSFSSPRKKFALCLTFTLGLFVTVCSVVRLQYLTVWGHSSNLTWGYNPIAIWSNVECNASVLCANMPSLAGLLQRIWARAADKTFSSYGRGSVSMREHERRSGDYELRLRSTSLSGVTGRIGGDKRGAYPNGLDMNPMGSSKPHLVGFESETASSRHAPSPLPHPPGGPEAEREQVTMWYATKPLPKLKPGEF